MSSVSPEEQMCSPFQGEGRVLWCATCAPQTMGLHAAAAAAAAHTHKGHQFLLTYIRNFVQHIEYQFSIPRPDDLQEQPCEIFRVHLDIIFPITVLAQGK